MKITETNALRIAMYGASAYWFLGSISFLHDKITGDLNSKSGWVIGFVVSSATCGVAFYCFLVPLVLRSLRTIGFPRTVGGITKFAWASSPLPAVAVALGLLLFVVFRNG